MNFSILEILPELVEKIAIVDIGARFTEHERYAQLLEANIVKLIGFEPDEGEIMVLEELYPKQIFFPYFIADGKQRTFYKCHYGGCSSLYRPDPSIINHFTSMSTSSGSNFEVVSEELVQTLKLDDIGEVEYFDFLKVDVQGAELDVLKGSREKLKNCLIAELEVEFLPIYEKQPLFGDVDLCMRNHGFFLHRLIDVSGRAFRPFSVDSNPAKPVSQLLWADAVYVRNFTNFEKLETLLLLKLAILLHTLYSSVDLCARVLAHYDNKQKTELQNIYLETIRKEGVESSFINIKDWTD